MKIFLYIKQHNLTGLKYFGKTTSEDPYKYIGSGKYWKNHLKKYGNNVSTITIWEFENLKDCQDFALKFSSDNNIIKSSEWANLILENSIDGWPKGMKRGKQTQQHRLKNSIANSGINNAMYGKKKDSHIMKNIGAKGLEKQNELRLSDPEWAKNEKERLKKLWQNDRRKIDHIKRFTGKIPAVCAITRNSVGLVDKNDPRFEKGTIVSANKGIKKGITKAKGKSKPKLICRIVDKKEMDLANFMKWLKNNE